MRRPPADPALTKLFHHVPATLVLRVSGARLPPVQLAAAAAADAVHSVRPERAHAIATRTVWAMEVGSVGGGCCVAHAGHSVKPKCTPSLRWWRLWNVGDMCLGVRGLC